MVHDLSYISRKPALCYLFFCAQIIRTFMVGAASQENLSSGFLTRSNTYWAVQPQKMAIDFKFQI